MNCISCPKQSQMFEKGVRQPEGRKKSVSSGGLSPHPAESGRGDSVEDVAGGEQTSSPEGRGGRDRPCRVRIQQQAERGRRARPAVSPERQALGWTVHHKGKLCVCCRSPRAPPFLSKAAGSLSMAR